jgi:SAM-dependent methyltransferase
LPLGEGQRCRKRTGHRPFRTHARARPEFPGNDGITYRQADLDAVELPQETFGLAFSSLALHYIHDLPRLLGAVHQALAPGGHFCFSTEHPIYLAPSHPGWVSDAKGDRRWALDRYSMEGPRTVRWLGHDVVKQHRTLATLINALLTAGFTLSRLDEWAPDDAQIDHWPDLAEERERPMFVLISAVREH